MKTLLILIALGLFLVKTSPSLVQWSVDREMDARILEGERFDELTRQGIDCWYEHGRIVFPKSEIKL